MVERLKGWKGDRLKGWKVENHTDERGQISDSGFLNYWQRLNNKVANAQPCPNPVTRLNREISADNGIGNLTIFVLFFYKSFMKSILSFSAIFILFQSLMFGNLVRLELSVADQGRWGEIHINKQGSIDLFLRPDEGKNPQTHQTKNHWIPSQFNNAFNNKNISTSPEVAEIHVKSLKRHYYSAIPVFIFTGALRL